MRDSSNQPYSSKVIKASALIADTRVLLSEWDLEQPLDVNLNRVRQQNVLGKASRKRVDDILVIFRQRYFSDPDVGQTLVTLAQNAAPAQWLNPLLYFFAAQNDRTLRDLVTEVLYPRHLGCYIDLPTEVATRAIRNWAAEGKTTSAWGENTIDRVARNSLTALRDFGALQGTKHKRLAPVYLPTEAFALIAHWLQQRLQSGERVLNSDDWKLFFLPVEGVERFFLEAHQEHILGYHAAGSVIRIEFPADTLREYADVLIRNHVERAR